MCFWLPGFSNPQGFLTAVRQEVCRGLASPKPALDDLITTLVVTDFQDADAVRMPAAEGVYIHGFVLEGAAWRPTERTLVECTTKLRVPFPVLLLSAATPWAARAKVRASLCARMAAPIPEWLLSNARSGCPRLPHPVVAHRRQTLAPMGGTQRPATSTPAEAVTLCFLFRFRPRTICQSTGLGGVLPCLRLAERLL